MGLPILSNRKRVILPMYKQTDHTPAFYKDPFTNKLIPTAYFLKNLDEIGPQHWQNNFTSDFLLRVVRTTEIDYYCNYFISSSVNNEKGNATIINCSNSTVSASEAAEITNYFNVMLFNYQQHLYILATQSGFFNQLLGPINSSGNRPKYSNTLTIPIPYPEVFEPILHWLYHHDDDAWLDLINTENFPKFYANVSFLKLGREAYDILDTFIEEAEETGVDINFDGIVELY
ncbi:16139_t:CDS:2 [Funneliformis caledonium]|uniref:16139_t:CDS:1 n=2 Tax=Funneliformis TaxID=1117308 RepID=A0A9N9BZY1_9GLOM|nr:13624_t:CDS:2 [Funneliformis mosseae]CAG8581914.1 16139_t:CDS:2 [Funneliformis caledonium]